MRISKYSGYGLAGAGLAAEPFRPVPPPEERPTIYIEVDLSTVPPALRLRDAKNFDDFEVIATTVGDTAVSPDAIRALPTDMTRAEDWGLD